MTVESPAKRALPVDAAAWHGWLYSGGHAPLCSHQVETTQNTKNNTSGSDIQQKPKAVQQDEAKCKYSTTRYQMPKKSDAMLTCTMVITDLLESGVLFMVMWNQAVYVDNKAASVISH